MRSILSQFPEQPVRRFAALMAVFVLSALAGDLQAAMAPIEGRWNITVDVKGQKLPSWLEVRHSGHKTLVGYFVSSSGSARPISVVHFKDNQFNFAIPPQWEAGNADLKITGTLQGDKISGTMISSDGATYTWTGERAPTLRRTTAVKWGTPVKLIKSNSLEGWKALGATNQWTVKDGILASPKSGANLITEAKFNDFKLHVEFRVPKGSNSGVYLRGRYEVQVADSKGMEPAFDQLGAIYGFIIPIEMMAKAAGEWQSMDVTLVGRLVTVAINGKTVIHTQEIPGITGGALDSHEASPGPLLIQGDHGPIDYRNITITPAL